MLISTSRVANLEQKLDSIVSLLSTNKESSSEHITPPTLVASSTEPDQTSPDAPSPYPVTSNGHDAHASDVLKHTREVQYGVRGCAPPLSEATPLRDALRPADNHVSSAGSSLPRDITFQDGERDNMLRYYRTVCMTFFPFPIVPEGTRFDEAHKTSPFLYDVITFVTSVKDFKRQAALGEKLLEDVVNRLLLRPQKTEELLTGMLLFATW